MNLAKKRKVSEMTTKVDVDQKASEIKAAAKNPEPATDEKDQAKKPWEKQAEQPEEQDYRWDVCEGCQ